MGDVSQVNLGADLSGLAFEPWQLSESFCRQIPEVSHSLSVEDLASVFMYIVHYSSKWSQLKCTCPSLQIPCLIFWICLLLTSPNFLVPEVNELICAAVICNDSN